MKGLHKIQEKLQQARTLEKDGDFNLAEKLYLGVLNKSPAIHLAYDRLMIIYRKQKEFKRELELIERAVKAYQKDYLDRQQTWIRKNKSAAELTQPLAISLGLMTETGLPLVSDPMLIRWQKRAELLRSRLAKQKAAKRHHRK